jgi:hypothetical protein
MDVDQLTLRDLRLEAELENISKHSVPSKAEEKQPPTNLLNTPVSDINLRDVGIEEQLQKISRNATKDVYGWKPSVIKSHVTNEMIQEYQDELANSFYDDPITGRRLKYVPTTDFTLEEYRPKGVLADVGITEAELRREQLQLAELRKRHEQDIRDYQEELEGVKDTVEFKSQSQFQSQIKSFYNREFLRKHPELNTETDYLRWVTSIENHIYESKARIFEIDARIAEIQEMLTIDKEVQSENQAEKNRIEKANYETLKAKSEELNLLNRGRMNLERQPSESNEDFQQRLIDVGQVEFDEQAIEEQAGRRAITKFKENMKKITRNNILIENMIKSVQPSRLFLYNKYFSAIESKMKEVYGAATFKEGDYQELLTIFDNIIGKVSLETERVPVQEVVEPNEVETFQKFVRASQTPTTARKIAQIEGREPFNERWVPRAGKQDFRSEWEAPTAILLGRYTEPYRLKTGKYPTGDKINIFRQLYEQGFLAPPTPVSPFEGEGLKHENQPKFAHLGKIAINPHALYYNNTLIVMNHLKNHILGYKNTKVSEDFVSILMDLLKGKFPTHQELKKLDLGEKELYDNLVHLAHLHKKVEHNLPQTKQSMKHRFELLNGEIGAGNTNKALKDELKQLVHKMAYAGMISHNQSRIYLKSL